MFAWRGADGAPAPGRRPQRRQPRRRLKGGMPWHQRRHHVLADGGRWSRLPTTRDRHQTGRLASVVLPGKRPPCRHPGPARKTSGGIPRPDRADILNAGRPGEHASRAGQRSSTSASLTRCSSPGRGSCAMAWSVVPARSVPSIGIANITRPSAVCGCRMARSTHLGASSASTT